MKFRSNPTALRGSIAPLVTPFTGNGSLDLDSLRAITAWQIDSGSHGVAIGGSTSEPSAQSVDERVTAIRTVAEEVADRVPFVAGTGAAKLDDTLRLTHEARAAGADAALVITPYYARPSQQGLHDWYAAIATAFPDLPIIIYNVPSRTAVDVAPETVAALYNRFDNIVGIKETTKDFEHFSRVLQLAGRDIMVWSGIELLCLPLLSLGGAGMVSAAANLAPGAVAQLFDAWATGDQHTALNLHYRLHPVVDAVFVETNPAPAKWVLRQIGLLASDHVRPPLAALSAPGQAKVRSLLSAADGLTAGLSPSRR